MAAPTITNIFASISDAGSGANPHADVTVTLSNGEVYVHHIDGSTAFGLTGPQITSMQNTLNVLRGLATSVTRTALTIP